MEFIDRSIMLKTPVRPAGLVRISEDPEDKRLGVTRQETDVRSMHARLGWGGELDIIRENDTSAYKRRRVTLPDGTKRMRVVRPEFDDTIAKIYSGEIDGIIAYDLDRLVRQPRQLEDLIEAVESACIPVHSFSGGLLNLLTADGRANARVLCAMAAKQSDDTSRRVARAAFSAAQDGTATRGGPRRFGWQADGITKEKIEADAIAEAVKRAAEGESLWSICMDFQARGIASVNPDRKKAGPGAGKLSRTALNQILRSPRIAGLRTYAGVGRGRPVRINDWRNRIATDKNGKYVTGPWEPIVSVSEWELLQSVLDSQDRQKKTPGGYNTRRYLLTSFLRCGACGAKMTGKPPTSRRPSGYYQCLPKDQGGCNGVSRDMAKVDKHVKELLLRRLERRAGIGASLDTASEEIAHAQAEIDRLESSRRAYTARWKAGKETDARYFAICDELDEEINKYTGVVASHQRRTARPVINRPREAWDAGTLSQRRAMLAGELRAVVVMPQAQKGRWGWNPDDLKPAWLEEGH